MSDSFKRLSKKEEKELKNLAQVCDPTVKTLHTMFTTQEGNDELAYCPYDPQLPMNNDVESVICDVEYDDQIINDEEPKQRAAAVRKYVNYMDVTMTNAQVPKAVKDESIRWSRRYLNTMPVQVLANDTVLTIVQHVTGRVLDAITKSTLYSTISGLVAGLGTLTSQVNNLKVSQDQSAQMLNSISSDVQQVTNFIKETPRQQEKTKLYEVLGALRFYTNQFGKVFNERDAWNLIKKQEHAILQCPEDKFYVIIKALYNKLEKL